MLGHGKISKRAWKRAASGRRLQLLSVQGRPLDQVIWDWTPSPTVFVRGVRGGRYARELGDCTTVTGKCEPLVVELCAAWVQRKACGKW